jgi:hypothetical protein
MKTGNNRGLALALIATLVSCATENDASIEVFGICGFPEDAAKCVTTGKCETLLAVRPFVFTRRGASNTIQNSLDLYVQVNNELKSNEDLGAGKLNTNDFVIDEFRYKFSSVPSLSIPEFTYEQNHIVPTDGSVTPLIPLIPAEIMATIDAEDLTTMYVSDLAPNARVDVELRVHGHTRDGREIETAPWVVPVDVYDVDTAGVIFDPTCVKTTEVVTAICPHGGQVASFTCEAPL